MNTPKNYIAKESENSYEDCFYDCYFKKGILLFVLSFIAFSSIAQNQLSSVRFKHYSLEHGLSQTSVLCGLQDSEGYMWFGTRDGLNRFDGYEFEVFVHQGEDPKSISHNWIRCIYEDSKGFLWLGTDNGLNKYSKEAETFIAFQHDQSLPYSISGNLIRDIIEDKSGNLWVATSEGLNKLDKERKNFVRFLHDSLIVQSISHNNLRSLMEDSQGNIWVVTKVGIDVLNVDTEVFTHYDIPYRIEEYFNVSCLFEDDRGRIWYGDDNGLYIFDNISNVFRPYYLNEDDEKPLIESSTRDIYEDNLGRLWIGTYNGIYIVDIEGKSLEHINYDHQNPQGLSQNSIYSITSDSRGDLWIGTYSGALNYFNHSFDVFEHYAPGSTSKHLSYRVVSEIIEDDESNLWIGTEGGGVNYFDRATKTFQYLKHDPNDPNSLSYNNVKSLLLDRHSNLWVGTHDGGVNSLNIKTNKITRYLSDPKNENSLSNNRVIALLEGSEDKIWMGTFGNGIDIFDPFSETFQHLSSKLPEVGEFIYHLGFDAEGRVLVGSEKGLTRIHELTYELLPFDEKGKTFNVIPDRNVLSFYEQNQDSIWIGTEGAGLFLYERNIDRISNFDLEDGLPNNVVYGILEDEHGNLWVSTINGLGRFNLASNSFKTFNLHDGLQSNEFNYRAYLKDREGALIFGGVNGFNVFNPELVKDNEFVPPVIITQLLINNQRNSIQDFIKSEKGANNSIELAYDQSDLGFEFVALSFSQPQKNEYAYRLEGYDEEWVNIGNRRSVSYTNLPFGDYTFHLKASNSDGVWNEEGQSIDISIMPPPWRTWYAYLGYAILTVLMSLLLYRLIKVRNLEMQELKRARMEKEKIEELNQMKLEFFTNISHEFRTPLTLIIGPLERMLSSSGIQWRLNDQLNIMKKNAYILLKLVNQLMDFRKNESVELELKVGEHDIVEFVHEVMLAFTEHARYRNIQYELHCKEDTIEAWFDASKIEEVLFNLLSNAFKFTPDGGAISISIDPLQDEEMVSIKVQDNGSGIASENLTNIFKKFYQVRKSGGENLFGTGLGLTITQKLVELHHGSISVDSRVNSGSTFTVKLPISISVFDNDNIEIVGGSLQDQKVSYSTNDDISTIDLDSENQNEVHKGLPHILVVEDNEMVRDYITECLEGSYEVTCAENGEEGLALALQIIPELILCDIMMPKMDGVELCSLVKKNLKTNHIPVIILTARASDSYRKEGLEKGADDYITKPFNPDLLLTRINNLIESRKVLKEKLKREITMEPTEVTVVSANDEFLKKCVEIVETNMSNSSLSVSTFLDEVGMSRSVFFKKLKAITDHSVTEFVRSIRLKRAAQLLRDSDMNVSEIAYAVGFNDLKYFRNCFRKLYDRSPTEYRSSLHLIKSLNESSENVKPLF